MSSYCHGAYSWPLLCFKHSILPFFLVYCTLQLYAMMFLHSTCMYVFQTIRTCGFWKTHNTLFNSKRLANEPRQLLTIIDNFDMVLYMYVAVLLVFDRISYRPGEGHMRPNVVSTKLNSTKRRPLDVTENSLNAFSSAITSRD